MAEAALPAHGWPWTLDPLRLAGALSAAAPPLLFGLRPRVSVGLGLYVAFRLELDNAYWAAPRPHCMPAAPRRVAAQGLVADDRHQSGRCGDHGADWVPPAGPRSLLGRAGFVGHWVSAHRYAVEQLRCLCSGAGRLRGGDHCERSARRDRRRESQVFMLAVTRTSEMCIGIVCAGVVLAVTDLGHARNARVRFIENKLFGVYVAPMPMPQGAAG